MLLVLEVSSQPSADEMFITVKYGGKVLNFFFFLSIGSFGTYFVTQILPLSLVRAGVICVNLSY